MPRHKQAISLTRALTRTLTLTQTRALTLALTLAVALPLAGCGGGSSDPVTPAAPQLVQVGFIDFEAQPDDGFVGVNDNSVGPIDLGQGVTATGLNGATFYDMTTADTWGLNGCNAEAFSGTKLIGAFNGADELRIDLPVLASRVDAYISDGATAAQLEAFDAADQSLGVVMNTPACPALSANDLVSIDVGTNTIAYVVLSSTGNSPVMDDLAWFQMQ